jgi:hypothetical protein
LNDTRKKEVSFNLEPMKSKRDAIKVANDEKHSSIIEEVGPELDKFENKMYNSSANRTKAIKD